ncbi:MAG: molybdopterin molybdotransferase MoeA [Acidobacteriia bacterium]|nr:molybdopterin molybdotransferase MoeA [Terriglobia bacterium]
MISVDEARQKVIDTCLAKRGELGLERVALEEALGRVLAEDLCADTDQPPFDRSTKDGYALRSADVQDVPVELRVIGESKAGDASPPRIGAREAAQVMTGAAIPPGADAVVMVEEVESLGPAPANLRADAFDSGRIRIKKSLSAGTNVSFRGNEARKGDVLVPRGRSIEVHEISLAASIGVRRPWVFNKPRVGILATGDELVSFENEPGQNQIRNSNSYALLAMARKSGAAANLLGIARDDLQDLRQKIHDGLESSDCLLLTGGVSAGKYDFVEPVLKESGVEFCFDAVAIRPGKPAVFGTRGHRFVFALPGNPVSAIVTYHLFVAPLVDMLSGGEPRVPSILNARLENTFKQPTGRRGFLPAHFEIRNGDVYVSTVRWRGSSDLAGLARSNCFLIAPEKQAEFKEEECVKILVPSF